MNRLIVGMHACVVAYGTAVKLERKSGAAAAAPATPVTPGGAGGAGHLR